MGTKIAAMMGLALLLSSTAAMAEEKAKPHTPGILVLPETVIPGRVQKPQVTIDIARVLPRVKLSELRQPFVEKIGQAASKDAF